jgi:hypothetical protein
MKNLRNVGDPERGCRAQVEYQAKIESGKATPSPLQRREVQGDWEEIKKLLSSGFIQEVFHPEWLANPVLVKKKNKKWRMCVDYTGLNKACPKVLFPLLHIDQVVDSTAGCETLYFLDEYSGYHQIVMCTADQLTTSFITPFGAYIYKTMPFELKNTGAAF